MNKEQIQDIIMRNYKNQYLYHPNFCTKHQLPIGASKKAIEDLIQYGFVIRVKAPKVNGQILMEYVVKDNEPFPEDMQDDDYMPLEKGDYEVSEFYKVVG